MSALLDSNRQTDQLSASATTPHKKLPIRKRRQSASGLRRNASRGQLAIFCRIGGGEEEVAVGFLDEELTVGENDVGDAEAGFFPLDFAGGGFDAAELGDALVFAAVDAVEVAVVLD